MKVAFVSQPTAGALPPTESIAIATLEVARRMAARPEVEEVAIYSRREPAPPPERVEGVEHRYVAAVNDWRTEKVLRNLWPSRSRVPLFASGFSHVGYGIAVARDLRRRGGATVVHLNNTTQYAPVITRIAPSSRVVLHMHCEWLSDLDRAVVARRLRAVDVVVACSGHVAGLARAAHPDAAVPICVVPHGVDLDCFAPPGETRGGSRTRILFVSRISPEKGVHVLADAFAALVGAHPEAELRIVGEEGIVAPDMLARISRDPNVRLLERLSGPGYLDRCLDRLAPDVRDRVSLAGALDRDGVARELRAADLLVSPSLSEAFGMALLEAMAAGLPVVASRVGGMPEIVEDGRTGLLVEPGDAGALASALQRLLADPVERHAMGAAGRARVEDEYGWDGVVESLLHVYEAALTRR